MVAAHGFDAMEDGWGAEIGTGTKRVEKGMAGRCNAVEDEAVVSESSFEIGGIHQILLLIEHLEDEQIRLELTHLVIYKL